MSAGMNVLRLEFGLEYLDHAAPAGW